MTGTGQPGAPTLADLSVVVLSHNRREELMRNLEELCALRETAGFELVVVDNASTDGTRAELARLTRLHPELIVLLPDENLGVARGRNLGWGRATRAFILNLDDDTHLALEDMRAMLRALDSESVGIVTPQVVEATTGAVHNGDYAGRVREPANFAGACHLVRRAVWDRVGELDPGCSFGGEEIDYSIRSRAAGYSTVCVAEATARHHGMTRGAGVGRRRREQWVYNYTRVVFKHFPLSKALLFASRGLVSHLLNGIAAHGPAIAAPLVWNTLRGARAGRKRYAALPEPALRFYLNPALRPDFGQIPLSHKLVERLRRVSTRSAAATRRSA
jgi:GT2 family glycosyltransferase